VKIRNVVEIQQNTENFQKVKSGTNGLGQKLQSAKDVSTTRHYHATNFLNKN